MTLGLAGRAYQQKFVLMRVHTRYEAFCGMHRTTYPSCTLFLHYCSVFITILTISHKKNIYHQPHFFLMIFCSWSKNILGYNTPYDPSREYRSLYSTFTHRVLYRYVYYTAYYTICTWVKEMREPIQIFHIQVSGRGNG